MTEHLNKVKQFTTPEIGAKLIKHMYTFSDVTSGEFVSSLKFSEDTPFDSIIKAVVLFLAWDSDDLEENGEFELMDSPENYSIVVRKNLVKSN